MHGFSSPDNPPASGGRIGEASAVAKAGLFPGAEIGTRVSCPEVRDGR